MLELQPTTCWAAVSDVMVPGSVLASVDHRSRSWIQKLRVGKICRSSWLDHGWNCQNSICTDMLDGIRPIFAPMVGSVFLYHVRSLYLFICEVLFPNQSLDTAVSWLQLKIETLKTHKNNSWRAGPYVWVFSYSNTGTGGHVLAFECPWARKGDQKPARDCSSFLQIDVVMWKMETGVQTLTTTY